MIWHSSRGDAGTLKGVHQNIEGEQPASPTPTLNPLGEGGGRVWEGS